MTDRGQATVELALVLPIVVILIAGLIQIGLVVTTQVMLENAAREGARAAAIAPNRAVAEAHLAAGRAVGDRRITVDTALRPDHVTVTVMAAIPVLSFLPGMDDRRLSADVTMRREDLP